MIKLFIDQKTADIDQATPICISLSIASLTQIESAKTGYSKTFAVPMTARNMQIMGDTDQVNSVQMFNQENHQARIESDGFTVMEGALCLLAVEGSRGGGGRYVCNIIGAGKLWVKHAAESMFKDVNVDFEQVIGEYSISQSWVGDRSVRFLPVQRDRFAVENSSANLFPPAKVLSFEDYHPFLNVRAVMEAIVERSGYTISSRFMDSAYFRSLHMSGRYPTKNVDTMRERMDFLAGKFARSEATADSYGRVYADPNRPLSSVGNVVDTADPKQIQNSAAIDGVYNTNNCFQMVGNRIAFVPVQEVSVGFEYKIKYSTDYYMLTRGELKCFNFIYLGEQQRSFKIVNRNADQKSNVVANKAFMLIVFGFVSGQSYQIRYSAITNTNADSQSPKPGDTTTYIHSTFSSRTTNVTIGGDAKVVSIDLFLRNTSGQYTLYQGDWALYDGYVRERGTVEVEAVVRSSPEKVTPGKPKYFDRMYFGGAEPGMKLTVSNLTTIRPIFLPHPSEGSTVRFEHVAAHEIRQIEFVNSIKQLFNLYFYTDNFEKVIYIEPREEFYRDDVVVDWSHKIDQNHGVAIEELGGDMSRTLVLQYQDGDGTVARWDEAAQQKMGRWSATIDNNFAKEGRTLYANPIFTPSRNAVGDLPDAPSASLIQVGDRDRQRSVRSEDLNFPPKIAHFFGMAPLPEGQRWGWPGYGTSFPFVAFHHQGVMSPPYSGLWPDPDSVPQADGELDMAKIMDHGISLCFEDRDSIGGIHRYYDNNIELYNLSKRVTLNIHLLPQDVEPFIIPNSLRHDFRALFRLKIEGEYALLRLEQICDYNPTSGESTKCIFIKNL